MTCASRWPSWKAAPCRARRLRCMSAIPRCRAGCNGWSSAWGRACSCARRVAFGRRRRARRSGRWPCAFARRSPAWSAAWPGATMAMTGRCASPRPTRCLNTCCPACWLRCAAPMSACSWSCMSPTMWSRWPRAMPTLRCGSRGRRMTPCAGARWGRWRWRFMRRGSGPVPGMLRRRPPPCRGWALMRGWLAAPLAPGWRATLPRRTCAFGRTPCWGPRRRRARASGVPSSRASSAGPFRSWCGWGRRWTSWPSRCGC